MYTVSYHYSSLMCFCPSIQGCSIYNLEYSCKNWFYIRRGPPDPTLQGNGQEEVLWSKDENTCSPGGSGLGTYLPDIFRIMLKTLVVGVLEFIDETNLLKEARFFCLKTLRALAIILIAYNLFLSVGCLLYVRLALFLSRLALMQSSSNQGFPRFLEEVFFNLM